MLHSSTCLHPDTKTEALKSRKQQRRLSWGSRLNPGPAHRQRFLGTGCKLVMLPQSVTYSETHFPSELRWGETEPRQAFSVVVTVVRIKHPLLEIWHLKYSKIWHFLHTNMENSILALMCKIISEPQAQHKYCIKSYPGYVRNVYMKHKGILGLDLSLHDVILCIC